MDGLLVGRAIMLHLLYMLSPPIAFGEDLPPIFSLSCSLTNLTNVHEARSVSPVAITVTRPTPVGMPPG